MKRRQFLKSAGTTLALASFGLNTTLAAAAEDFHWSRASADALVGQSFWLNHPEFGAMAITLAAVRVPPSRTPDPRLDQFSLLFRTPAGFAVADGIYEMDHPALGRFSLHLAPGGHDAQGAMCRSDFTLLT